MREAGRRLAAMIGQPQRWETVVEWTVDGRTWGPCVLIEGSVTRSALSQASWALQATVDGLPEEVTPLGPRVRVRHGVAGVELLPFGIFKVTEVTHRDDGATELAGLSSEVYLLRDELASPLTVYPTDAETAARTLIRQVFPSAALAWEIPGAPTVLPRMEGLNRWEMLDGRDSSPSIAKAVGGRLHVGPTGGWIMSPTPTLADPVVWEATDGQGGVLLQASEALSDADLANRLVVEPDGGAIFPVQVVEDLDPLSPTYTRRRIEDGGFGVKTFRYRSSLITNRDQALQTARSLLAPRLGLRQQITFTQAHDPRLEPGDVGIVHTTRGPRRAILDSVTYDLNGGPLQTQTRTTATRLAGDVYEVPEDGGEG